MPSAQRRQRATSARASSKMRSTAPRSAAGRALLEHAARRVMPAGHRWRSTRAPRRDVVGEGTERFGGDAGGCKSCDKKKRRSERSRYGLDTHPAEGAARAVPHRPGGALLAARMNPAQRAEGDAESIADVRDDRGLIAGIEVAQRRRG